MLLYVYRFPSHHEMFNNRITVKTIANKVLSMAKFYLLLKWMLNLL